MKTFSGGFRWSSSLFAFVCGLASIAGVSVRGASSPTEALVWGLTGNALYSAGGAPGLPVAAGMSFVPGTVIKTGAGAVVDLFLGDAFGHVRLVENSRLEILKLHPPTSGDAGQLELDLQAGSLVGTGHQFATPTSYQVKVSNGIAGIGRAAYRVNARGFLVVLEGTGVFAYVPATGEPGAHVVSGPPASYFSPFEGVRASPPALTTEVSEQLRARLRYHLSESKLPKPDLQANPRRAF